MIIILGIVLLLGTIGFVNLGVKIFKSHKALNKEIETNNAIIKEYYNTRYDIILYLTMNTHILDIDKFHRIIHDHDLQDVMGNSEKLSIKIEPWKDGGYTRYDRGNYICDKYKELGLDVKKMGKCSKELKKVFHYVPEFKQNTRGLIINDLLDETKII